MKPKSSRSSLFVFSRDCLSFLRLCFSLVLDCCCRFGELLTCSAMAGEVPYAPIIDSNKRKHEDSLPPPPSIERRRPTGFSAPIAPQQFESTPPSYNKVPTPDTSVFEDAKKRAQEIASRLLNEAEAKRSKFDNGGFDSTPSAIDQKPLASNASMPSFPPSYGYQSNSKKIHIPNARVGVIIGKGGETIKYLQTQSGAKIQITRDTEADLSAPTRMVELMGTPDQIAKAEQLMNEVLSQAEAGGSSVGSRRLPGSESFSMRVANNKVGLVIGKGGETIKNIQARTGARVQVIPLRLPPGDTSTERTVQIEGTQEQIDAARQLVDEATSENRPRNQSMAGGYSQQGYQGQPPSWAPGPPPIQQPGYGYMQPGVYPGASPQSVASQAPYAGYPSQPTPGGYSTGWDQNSAPPGQQAPQGTGYDYYNQQQQQQGSGAPASADSSGYSYSQQPSTGYGQQGYSQNGYGSGYQAPGYGQPSQNPHQVHEQQQSYNSAQGYGNVTNPAHDGHSTSYASQGEPSQAAPPSQASLGQQGYNMNQQSSTYGVPPAPQSGYGSQPSARVAYPGCGAPQAQKTPMTLSEPQQLPSQIGYSQPASGQSVYPGYPGSQIPTNYGAAPPAHPSGNLPPSYGQQQTAYQSSYESVYGQPPAYPTDGNAAAPPQAAGQLAGSAKTSPQSLSLQ